MTSSFPKKISINDEIDLKQKTADVIKREYGEDIFYYLPSDRFRKAIPDIILCFFGWFVAIELKMEDSREPNGSPLQQYNLRKIQRANGFSIVANNIPAVMEGLRKIQTIINRY